MKIQKYTLNQKRRQFNSVGIYPRTSNNIMSYPSTYGIFVQSQKFKLQPGILHAKQLQMSKMEGILLHDIKNQRKVRQYKRRKQIMQRKRLEMQKGNNIGKNVGRISGKLYCGELLQEELVNQEEIIGEQVHVVKNGTKSQIDVQLNTTFSKQKIQNIAASSQIKIIKKAIRESTPKYRSKKLVKLKQIKKLLRLQDFIPYEQIQVQILKQGKKKDVTAKSYSVMIGNKRVHDHKGDQVRQIASVTKVMTCIVCLYLAKKYAINIYEETVKVSRNAASIEGTTAHIQAGDMISINQLLYGLILPSGNDASVALAQYFHKLMQQKLKNNQDPDLEDPTKLNQGNKKCNSAGVSLHGYRLFIREMNRFAKYLNLKKSNFNNPHGLSDKYNVSTANDVAQLSYFAMKNQQFQKYAKALSYETKIYNSNSNKNRQCIWENSNKLLGCSDCIGVKTGRTPAAGPTMSAMFKKDQLQVIAVVLQTKTYDDRFSDASKLYEWAKSVTL